MIIDILGRYFLLISIVSILAKFLDFLFKSFCMALSSPPTPPPPSSSTPPERLPPCMWRRHGLIAKEEVSKREAVQEEEILPSCKGEVKQLAMSRKRPAKLVIPETLGDHSGFGDRGKRLDNKEYEVEGRDFFLASKKGSRDVMEDRHAAILDIGGDPKQAFFAVIDGHGGHTAADYVAENLGKNIVNQLQVVGNETETALRQAYSITDKQFLDQGENGGACAASVVLKDGVLHIANAGDCRAVLSRKGKAITLTNDHRLTMRKDERARIENTGGFLYCHNGVWRVNGSLAISRAFGDNHLKDWIISEPEIVKLPLTSDCDFLILASDGLWDKVDEQEAVDVVLGERNLMESCRKLVGMSSSRGNHDDITVMTINLSHFKMHVD